MRDKEEEEANEELIKELPEGELKDKVLDVIKKNVVMIKISIWDESKKAVAIANKDWNTWNLFVVYSGKVQEKWGYSFTEILWAKNLKKSNQ